MLVLISTLLKNINLVGFNVFLHVLNILIDFLLTDDLRYLVFFFFLK